MDGQRLPFDVLVAILDTSDLSTVAVCMRTCHTLYCHGAKLLLDDGVVLIKPNDFVSFLQFMQVDEQVRFKHLQSLEIASFPVASEAAMDALHKLIRHPLFSIHTLVLWDAEETLETSALFHETAGDGSPQILSTFSALRHLTVNVGGRHTSAFIRALRAPLETAHLNLDPPSGVSFTEPLDYLAGDIDPVTLLRACASSLHTITGTGFFTMFPGDDEVVPADVVFPRVHTLDLTYYPSLIDSGGLIEEGALPHTRRYMRAFPNLKRLALSMIPEIYGPEHPGMDAYFGDTTRPIWRLREENQKELRALQQYGEAWRGLEEVRGGMNDLYALGLALEVPRVVVEGDVDAWPRKYMLMEVLKDMRPTALTATFVGGWKTFGPNGMQITTLADREWSVRLAEVELAVKFQSTEGNEDVSVLLVSSILGEAIRATMLTMHHSTVSYGTSSRLK